MQAMQAFLAAFGDDSNYRLILKGRTSPVDASIINDNIELIQRDMTPAELYQLYLSADVLINANKGEGFGFIPREFARTGGISLTTNWAGTADALPEWGLPLAYKLVKADWSGHPRLSKQDLGQWAEVDQDYLVARMSGVAANRDHYRQWAKQWAANVARLYTWEGFAQTVLNVWESANGNSRAA
jgi:glycosyltransferase involved in cell wall biosynthesis